MVFRIKNISSFFSLDCLSKKVSRGSVDLRADANEAKTSDRARIKGPLDSAITKQSNFLTRTNTASTNKFDFLKSLTQRHKQNSISTTAHNSPSKRPKLTAQDSNRHLHETETIKIRDVYSHTSRHKKLLVRESATSIKPPPIDVDHFKGDLKWAAQSVSNFQRLTQDPKFTSSKSPKVGRRGKQSEDAPLAASTEQQKALSLIKLKKKFQEELTEIYMRLIRDKKKVYVKIVEASRD